MATYRPRKPKLPARLPPSQQSMPSAADLLGGRYDGPADNMPPSAQALLNGTSTSTDRLQRMPTAEELFSGTWDALQTDGEPPQGTASEIYAPTRSINPPRPRTLEMSYNRANRVLRVVYRDGGTYDYFGVPGALWYRIRNVQSPGRFIDRNIKGSFEFERVAL